MKKEIKIPDIAENVETGVIANVLVSEGDKISADQSVVEIETDKATTDIPSPYAGTVSEIKVSQGDEVKVNQVIMIIETEEEKDEEKDEQKKKKDDEKQKDRKKEETDKEKDKTKDKKKTEIEEEEAEDEEEQEQEQETDNEEKEQDTEQDDEKEQKESQKKQPSKEKEATKRSLSDIPAPPSVRRLAREMGVDLRDVEGSGPGKRISYDDVKRAAEAPADKETPAAEKIKLPDFSQWGATSEEPMSRIRQITSANVTASWQNIPHVTQFDEADMTKLEAFRKQNQEKVEQQGGKLTITALLVKISLLALQKFPRFNASIDIENKTIIYKHYFNIGVAVDTPQGLLVPVIRNVNEKSLAQLAAELGELAQKSRNKKISPDELQGGNFTISNLGGIGGTGFTPIVLPPQVAILGVSRGQKKPAFADGEIKEKMILPLSLSYDHRIIDGADGARFLRWICDVIENPYSILL